MLALTLRIFGTVVLQLWLVNGKPHRVFKGMGVVQAVLLFHEYISRPGLVSLISSPKTFIFIHSNTVENLDLICCSA